MLYRLTKQFRGARSGYFSHPKTLMTHIDKDYIIGKMNEEPLNEGEKVSVWVLDTSNGEWIRIASREIALHDDN